MRGKLEIMRMPPHFIRIVFTLPLEEGINNLSLRRMIESSVTIDKMTKEAGAYHLDYYVPVDTIVRDSVYLVDDTFSIQQYVAGQKKPQIRGIIRICVGRDDGTFFCAHDIPLDISERSVYPHALY